MALLALALVFVLAAPAAQAPNVVAESQATGEYGVAALQARLDGQRRYVLQVDGPPGIPFNARYMQIYVGRQPTGGGTGNDDGGFDATTPYERELLAPGPQLLFWRYSAVVSPNEPAELVVRVLDRGPR